MQRGRFLAGTLGAGLAGAASLHGARAASFTAAVEPRPGTTATLAELLAGTPPAAPGDVVQYELGFGARYDKQIGFGSEGTGADRLFFVETQVGNGDHACNPNTLKKAYLKTQRVSDPFVPYAALVYVTRSSNMMTRWGDGIGPRAADVLLLDAKTLYDPRAATVVAVAPERITVDGRALETQRVTAHYANAPGSRLRTVELWLSPHVPLGLVKMRATAPDLDPFELSLYTFGRAFKTSLALSLGEVRALTNASGDVPVIAP